MGNSKSKTSKAKNDNDDNAEKNKTPSASDSGVAEPLKSAPEEDKEKPTAENVPPAPTGTGNIPVLTDNANTSATTPPPASGPIHDVNKSREEAGDNQAPKSQSIAMNAAERSLHVPLRSYGLPEEMEGYRKQVWGLIFEQVDVDDWDTVVNLREVCKMFRDILGKEYVEARPEMLIKSRQEAYARKAREDIDVMLEGLEAEGRGIPVHEPLYPDRPYGLPEDKLGHCEHIWDLIFVQVNDLDMIVSLREVCQLFRDLLKNKYIAARLPEIVVKCLERKIIPWTYGRIEISNWVKTLSSLRVLSKATKNSVDQLFNRGLLPKEDWFWVRYPHFHVEHRKIPTLIVGSEDAEQMRLQKAIDSLEEEDAKALLPMKSIIFTEWRSDGVDVSNEDLQNNRSGFQKCLEKIGWNIRSFRYWTKDKPLNTYNNLRRWVALMPNLEELMVVFTGRRESTYYKSVDSFPSCPNLRRYVEGPYGFGIPFINEIFKANPTVEEVLLGKTPASNLEVKNLKKVLGTVNLTTFHCTCTPTIAFLEHHFRWIPQLTTLSLWDTTTTASTAQEEIPSDKLFNFISSCTNLKKLLVSSSRITDTGGYIKLPKLEHVHWKIAEDYDTLGFLKLLESLNWLAFDITDCPAECKTAEFMIEYLEDWHIPELFPGLKVIEVKTEANGNYRKIWKALA